MANAPGTYIDNIKIGSSTTAEIAAPYIITKVDEHGTPCTPKFKNFYELDYTKDITMSIPGKTWVVPYGDIDKTTPSVTCINDSGEVIYGDVKYDTTNKTITISFSEDVSGHIYIN